MISDLFKKRAGGSYNIKGILFQIRYSIYRTIESLLEIEGIASVQLEGIDDFDRIALDDGIEFTQVKSLDNPLQLSQFISIVRNYVLSLRHYDNASFRLVLDGKLSGSMTAVRDYATIQQSEQSKLRRKVLKLLEGSNSNNILDSEINDVLSRLTIEIVSEAEVQ